MSSISTSIDGRTSSRSRARTREDNVVVCSGNNPPAGAVAASRSAFVCSPLFRGDGEEMVVGSDMSASGVRW